MSRTESHRVSPVTSHRVVAPAPLLRVRCDSCECCSQATNLASHGAEAGVAMLVSTTETGRFRSPTEWLSGLTEFGMGVGKS
jgi:hypothetical protein